MVCHAIAVRTPDRASTVATETCDLLKQWRVGLSSRHRFYCSSAHHTPASALQHPTRTLDVESIAASATAEFLDRHMPAEELNRNARRLDAKWAVVDRLRSVEVQLELWLSWITSLS